MRWSAAVHPPASTGTVIDAATNGFDDNNNGVVDDIVYNGDPTAGENETAPPYPVPCGAFR